MPGVADAIRKTQLKQSKAERKQDMEELLKMVEEDRLRDADERQLENLQLALKLASAIQSQAEPKDEVLEVTKVGIDPDTIQQAIANAVTQALQQVGPIATGAKTPIDMARPQMGHTSLGNLPQSQEEVKISGADTLGEEVGVAKDGASKLEKLRKLKGNG